MRHLFLFLSLAFFIAHTAYASEPVPGDSCAAFPEGSVMRSGGPELGGNFYVMTCRNDVWEEAEANPADTIPNIFDFADVTDADLNTPITAAAVTIVGINTVTPVFVTGADAEISINGGPWVTAGNIENGQTLQVRLTSSASASTALVALVDVGGVTDEWSVTTRACSGAVVGGYCWYAGSLNQSCDTVCAGRGGCNLEGTRNYAGSGGINANCASVLAALGFSGSESFYLGSNANGCYYYPGASSQKRRRGTGTTVCNTQSEQHRRMCACNG